MPLSLEQLVEKIDAYAGTMTDVKPLKKIDSSTEEWLAGQVTELDHADNGAGSTLHPLSCIHFTTGAAPHYTLQSGWIQSLCLKKIGMIDDTGLIIVASGFMNATTKAEVKAAQSQAFGHAIQSIDNLHFYPAGGAVATAAPNLQNALALVQRVMDIAGPIGKAMNAKDNAYLAGIPVTMAALAAYGLKETEAPAWRRLEAVLNAVQAGRNSVITEKDMRQRRARELLDVLTRISGTEAG